VGETKLSINKQYLLCDKKYPVQMFKVAGDLLQAPTYFENPDPFSLGPLQMEVASVFSILDQLWTNLW